MTIRISKKFYEAVKLADKPGYKLAWKAGIHPVVLSKILHGYDQVKRNDERVLKVAKVIGLKPEECFEEEIKDGA